MFQNVLSAAVVIWHLKGYKISVCFFHPMSSKIPYDSVTPLCYVISKHVIFKIEFI